MAKLKAPLMSLGASGQLGKSLVFFPWKGLDVVREYVVPSNPKSDGQKTQRNYLTAAVAAIHTAEALASHAMAALDKTAYALKGSLEATPRTWFNTIVKSWIDQYVASLHGTIFHGCTIAGGDTIITAEFYFTDEGENHTTAGKFWYGTSKSALSHSVAASMFSDPYLAIGDINGLTNGTKYYVQFRATAHEDFVGVRSGIYHATPTAA